jgi:putative ubiquitin-RnfH superfamily antitoxin RatB of RatAB toxin-antitoxin module
MSDAPPERIVVEVVHALSDRQRLVTIEVEPGCSVRTAALSSGREREFPGLEIAAAPLGIFGRLVSNPEQTAVRAGDRVEIYRPLLVDPKVIRRLKAEEARQALPEQRRKR